MENLQRGFNFGFKGKENEYGCYEKKAVVEIYRDRRPTLNVSIYFKNVNAEDGVSVIKTNSYSKVKSLIDDLVNVNVTDCIFHVNNPLILDGIDKRLNKLNYDLDYKVKINRLVDLSFIKEK